MDKGKWLHALCIYWRHVVLCVEGMLSCVFKACCLVCLRHVVLCLECMLSCVLKHCWLVCLSYVVLCVEGMLSCVFKACCVCWRHVVGASRAGSEPDVGGRGPPGGSLRESPQRLGQTAGAEVAILNIYSIWRFLGYGGLQHVVYRIINKCE